jgi:hypothetical protein
MASASFTQTLVVQPEAGSYPVKAPVFLENVDGTPFAGVAKGAAVADLAAGADTAAIVTGFNALLASLRAAGIIAS